MTAEEGRHVNWQRDFANWANKPRTVHSQGGQMSWNVQPNPERGTAQQPTRSWTHRQWPARAYNYRKVGQHVRVPAWAAVELFLPTETPKFAISPFIRRALFRVIGRFRSANAELNKNFDLFTEDPAADRFAHALLQPQVVQWLLNDPRVRQVNLAFQTIVLFEGRDDVPYTQRHGVLVVEQPGQVETPGLPQFLADVGADFLSGLPGQLWHGNPPSGRPGR